MRLKWGTPTKHTRNYRCCYSGPTEKYFHVQSLYSWLWVSISNDITYLDPSPRHSFQESKIWLVWHRNKQMHCNGRMTQNICSSLIQIEDDEMKVICLLQCNLWYSIAYDSKKNEFFS